MLAFIPGLFGVIRGCTVCGLVVWAEHADRCPVCEKNVACAGPESRPCPPPPLAAVPEAV